MSPACQVVEVESAGIPAGRAPRLQPGRSPEWPREHIQPRCTLPQRVPTLRQSGSSDSRFRQCCRSEKPQFALPVRFAPTWIAATEGSLSERFHRLTWIPGRGRPCRCRWGNIRSSRHPADKPASPIQTPDQHHRTTFRRSHCRPTRCPPLRLPAPPRETGYPAFPAGLSLSVPGGIKAEV